MDSSKNIDSSHQTKTFVKQSSLLFVLMLAAGAINYSYQFLMGQMLGPADYGVIGVLSATLHLFLAFFNSIQTIAAKFVSAMSARLESGKVGWFLRRLSTKMILIGVMVFLVFVVISGLI